MSGLDDTDDERELTPVADLAEEIRAEIDRRVALSDREVELRDAFIEAAATHLARHLEHAHRIREATPRRVAVLEAWRAEVDPWRLRLTGYADGNGRMGVLTRTVEELREDLGTKKEREAERRTVAAVKWTTAKVLALISAAGLIAGGGAWQALRATATAKEAVAAAAARVDATRTEHERAQDESIGRLFTICTRNP